MPTVNDMLAANIYAELSISGFRLNIRAARRAVWLGEWTADEMITEMINIIDRGFEQAWREGESECGIKPDERSIEERAVLLRAQNEQLPFIEGFADAVEAGSKANGGLLRSTDGRVNMWVNRYNEVNNQAKALACSDLKYEWVLGPTEHCPDCLRLNGKVKRGSFWTASGIRPQTSVLFCGGFNCKCELVPTDKPLSRGPLPKLKGPTSLTMRAIKHRAGRIHITMLMIAAGHFSAANDATINMDKGMAIAMLESEE